MKLYIPASALGFDYLSLEVCVPVMFGSASSKGLPNLASFTFIKSGLFVLRICILYAFFFSPSSIVGEAVLLDRRLYLVSFSASHELWKIRGDLLCLYYGSDA